MASKEVLERLANFYSHLERENAVKERFSIKAQLDQRVEALNEHVQGLSPSMQGDLTEQITAIDEMTKRLDEKFSLFVAGSGKVGKSTVINALIGDEIAKMKETAMTWRVDVFHEAGNGNCETAEITYIEAGGIRKELLPIEAAKARIAEEEAKREEAIKQCNEKMQLVRERVKELPIKMRQEMMVEAQAQLNEKYQYISPVAEVRWPLQGSEILRHFQIVDTPGLTQDLNKVGVQKSMTSYYKEADGILCVLDINKNCEKASFAQVAQIGEELEKQGVVFEKAQMLGIMNRCDELKEQDKIPMLIEQGKKIYDGMLQDIIPMSARVALATQMTMKTSQAIDIAEDIKMSQVIDVTEDTKMSQVTDVAQDTEMSQDRTVIQDTDMPQGINLVGNTYIDQMTRRLEESGLTALKEYIYQHFLQSSSTLRIDKILQFVRSEEEAILRLVTNHREMIETLVIEEQRLSYQLGKDVKKIGSDLEERIKLCLNQYEKRVLTAIEEKTELLFTERHEENAYIAENIFMFPELKASLIDLNKDIKETLINFKEEYHTIILGNISAVNNQFSDASEELPLECIDVSEIDFDKYLNFQIFGALEQFQLVRSLVKTKRVKECKQQLEVHFNDLEQDIMAELTKGLIIGINHIEHQIEQMREMRFRNYYADEAGAKVYIQHLDQIAQLLNEPIKKNTIVAYIKGEVYDEY